MLRARPPNRPWQVARKNSDRDPPGHSLGPPAPAGDGRTPRWWMPVQRPVSGGRCCCDRRTCRGRPASAVHRRSAADLDCQRVLAGHARYPAPWPGPGHPASGVTGHTVRIAIDGRREPAGDAPAIRRRSPIVTNERLDREPGNHADFVPHSDHGHAADQACNHARRAQRSPGTPTAAAAKAPNGYGITLPNAVWSGGSDARPGRCRERRWSAWPGGQADSAPAPEIGRIFDQQLRVRHGAVGECGTVVVLGPRASRPAPPRRWPTCLRSVRCSLPCSITTRSTPCSRRPGCCGRCQPGTVAVLTGRQLLPAPDRRRRFRHGLVTVFTPAAAMPLTGALVSSLPGSQLVTAGLSAFSPTFPVTQCDV